ncbi:CLUMA_CG000435, isoform A [Clunio marinus]|uniref:CLUMA_CG000435, isoform A n=1 Tax=Clunio marinus TaxID=568069 RepID=A0A1J1HEW4_9DIPT|nr:CLUMA_CG000435, isoform A [Clunio marinus]
MSVLCYFKTQSSASLNMLHLMFKLLAFACHLMGIDDTCRKEKKPKFSDFIINHQMLHIPETHFSYKERDDLTCKRGRLSHSRILWVSYLTNMRAKYANDMIEVLIPID